MVNVSSLPGIGGSSFDLDSQAGVTQLLISIRASEISSDEKNDVRDLVFQYTNGGKDATVRRALEQKITTLGITPIAPKVVAAPLPPPPMIGTYRMAPAFVAPPVVSVPAASAPTPTVPVPPPVAPTPVPVVTRPPEPEPEPAPVSVTPEPKQTIEPEPVPVTPPSAPTPDSQDYLSRIREIKSIVNERVGNPVNLVDIDNTVGREYMSALLDAMKKLNDGSSPAPAMRRLEAAFTAVEETLEKHDKGMVEHVSQPVPEMPAREPEPVSGFSAPISDLVPPAAPVVPIPVFNEPEPESVVPTPAPTPTPAPVQTSWQPPVATNEVPPPPYAPATPASTPANGWNAVPTKTMATPLVHSIAESEPPKTPASLPLTRATEAVTPTGDVLHTEEVNQGLEQLLLEWSLFKKSGMFGTGPKGREHPLFKKIADLQIPLLLAGRFEGATQEIKQSITDYMNGWRYEQGIIYEPGELFEHYLRRVIRHILDLQKNKIR